MLGLEDGVSAHGRLASVIGRLRGREARADEIGGMAADRVQAFPGDVAQVLFGQMEAVVYDEDGNPDPADPTDPTIWKTKGNPAYEGSGE